MPNLKFCALFVDRRGSQHFRPKNDCISVQRVYIYFSHAPVDRLHFNTAFGRHLMFSSFIVAA